MYTYAIKNAFIWCKIFLLLLENRSIMFWLSDAFNICTSDGFSCIPTYIFLFTLIFFIRKALVYNVKSITASAITQKSAPSLFYTTDRCNSLPECLIQNWMRKVNNAFSTSKLHQMHFDWLFFILFYTSKTIIHYQRNANIFDQT